MKQSPFLFATIQTVHLHNEKKLIILSILFLVIVLPIYSLNDNVKLYSDRKFDSIEEHTDLNINGMKFNILHYIATCDNSNLIVSETISGGIKN